MTGSSPGWTASCASRRPRLPATFASNAICSKSITSRRRVSTRTASMPCAPRPALSGYAHREMVSGAGHDAIYVARVAPTAMIFVPCKDGISHNEIEDARPEHLEAGANVLCMPSSRARLDRALHRVRRE